MMEISAYVKKLRLSLFLTQQDFAKRLRVTPGAICHYENGFRTPKLSVMKRIKELAEKNDIDFDVKF